MDQTEFEKEVDFTPEELEVYITRTLEQLEIIRRDLPDRLSLPIGLEEVLILCLRLTRQVKSEMEARGKLLSVVEPHLVRGLPGGFYPFLRFDGQATDFAKVTNAVAKYLDSILKFREFGFSRQNTVSSRTIPFSRSGVKYTRGHHVNKNSQR